MCPSAAIESPVARVWDLLTSPQGFDSWVDATVLAAEPPGHAQAGQRLRLATSALGRTFPVAISVLEVDADRRRLRLLVDLPFGLRNDETITLAPAGEGQTVARFG